MEKGKTEKGKIEGSQRKGERNARRFYIEEKEKGSIEPGTFADFRLLDTDLIAESDLRVKIAKIVATFLDGVLVFSRRFN